MTPGSFPVPVRLAAAAVCAGLGWWAFGRAGAPGRRPGLALAAGFTAAWLVLAGEGVAFLIGRHARGWLPAVAVGVAGSWCVLRGRRGSSAGRRWAAVACALLVAAPFLSRANTVAKALFAPNERLAAWTGQSMWETDAYVTDGLGGLTVLLGTACVAAAVWLVPAAGSPGDRGEVG